MDAISYQFHTSSFLVPAQEQAKMRADEKAMKNIKIKQNAASCLNPDTTSGSCVTSKLLEEIKWNIQ